MVVDISPAQTTTRTNFRSYIQAMKDVKISSDIPRSTARRMAEDQLRKLVKVRSTMRLFSLPLIPRGLTGLKESLALCGVHLYAFVEVHSRFS